MRKILAVALLDCRRLGFGLVSFALVAGLIPSLASGLGAPVSVAAMLVGAFAIVGIAAGGSFGNDFGDGRSSFFFARPLSTGALIAGRFAGFLALAAAAFFAFMASYWLSTRGRGVWSPSILTRAHAEALFDSWAISLFFGLAIAARGRASRPAGALRTLVIIPLRLALSLGAFILIFGLFADLVLRAYFGTVTPIRLVVGSWVVASFVASCVAMAAGRTERLRIARFQNRVMIAYFTLVSMVVVATWTYVLHPGSDAIQRVGNPTWGSPDGRFAYVSTTVDRGDSSSFQPIFVLDIASGQARRLNADKYQGPWTSADGSSLVWSEATPFFFRPLWRYLGGATSFRVRTSSGNVEPLPMPKKLPDFFTARDLASFAGAVDQVIPSPDGDVFAILWDRYLTFTSRSRGELSEIDLQPDRRSVRGAVFLSSGDLRAAVASGDSRLEFVDIDPKSGTSKTVASMEVGNLARIQVDKNAARALLTSVTQPGQGASISLVDLSSTGRATRPTILLSGVLFPSAVFLADGRIATTGGGSAGARDKRSLRILSPTGQLVLDLPVGEGTPPRLGSEMFPGVLAVRLSRFDEELSLVDTNTGAIVRRLPGFEAPMTFSFSSPPPPGSPAARLMQSADGKLYELASLTAEPRLLLPLARR